MGRRAFLLAYVCLVIVETAIALATGNKLLADAIGFVPWLWMASKRLHDFNARWWWTLVPFVVGFIGGFVGGVAERFATAHATELSAANATTPSVQIDWTAVAQQPGDLAIAFAQGFLNAVGARIASHPIEFLFDAAFVLGLMLWPGTPGANRFGDPPGRSAAQST